MRSVFKYMLELADKQVIPMPRGAQPLTVQVQGVTPFVWVEVDTTAPVAPLTLYTRLTGHAFTGDEGPYIGTYQLQLEGGAFVAHVYTA